MYYSKTIAEIKSRLKKRFSKIVPSGKAKDDSPEYLLWMIEQVEEMPDFGRAARWIGWILCEAKHLGVITLREARDIMRKDVN